MSSLAFLKKRLSQLKIGQRLALSYGMVVLLLIAVSFVGIAHLGELSQASNAALRDKYPNTLLVSNMSNQLSVIAQAMRNTLILREAEQLQEQLALISMAKEKMALTLAQLKKRLNSPASLQVLQEIDIVHSAYVVNQEEFVSLVAARKLGEARNLLLVDVYDYQKNYFSLLDKLSQLQAEAMELASQEVANAYLTARNVMALLALLAVLLTICITWLITRSLLRKLGGEPDYAAAIAKKIAIGDLSSMIALHQNDHSSLLFAMSAMRDSLIERSEALQKTNRELAETIETLNRAQEELVCSEKLAALGSLVAGIAHELNTPIGNGMMAASTMTDLTRGFLKESEQGIKRSSLNTFLDNLQKGSAILLSNLTRAGDLIASFKQVAVDRTTSRGRRFQLASVVSEVLLTLQPKIKKTAFQFDLEIDEQIVMESYPGPLGQVLSNLIENAMLHGFDGRSHGTVKIAAQMAGEDVVQLFIQDDGCGIANDNLKRIYDPFFTTKLGAGGSGLGLHITHNIVTGILVGRIKVQSELGQGTCFTLALPLKLPIHVEGGEALHPS